MKKEISTFEEFWPYYVREHTNPLNRRLHFVGTTFAIGHLLKFMTSFHPSYLLKAAISGYFFAWMGHLFIEKNKPATFSYPLFSLMGDFKMYGLMWMDEMDVIVEEFGVTEEKIEA